MYDSSEEPCCMGFVTSGGDDRCHEPGCSQEQPPGPSQPRPRRMRVWFEGDQARWAWHTEPQQLPENP